jgi:formylglycine-generating enzyme required for sulfatase activity
VQKKDLCTPEQWELAYYGNAKKRYPYGDTYGFQDRDFCNTQGSADDVMSPSGVYEQCVNDIGIVDMGGNVLEWAGTNEKNVFMADQNYLYEALSQSLINTEDPTHRHYFLGFRCCKSDTQP